MSGDMERLQNDYRSAVKVIEKSDQHCFEKALVRGDATFTLVGQDSSSPRVIAYWILENIETASASKLTEALTKALVMRNNPNKKIAD